MPLLGSRKKPVRIFGGSPRLGTVSRVEDFRTECGASVEKQNPSFRDSAETIRFLASYEVRPGIGWLPNDLVASMGLPGTGLCGSHFSKMTVPTDLRRSL